MKPNERVVQVYIDEYSLSHLRESSGLTWPWPREAYGLMTSFFERAEANVVAYDFIFSEPSSFGVHDDGRFAAAMESAGNVVSAVFLGEEEGISSSWPKHLRAPWPNGRRDDVAMGSSRYATETPHALFPVEEIARPSRSLGNLNIVGDSDGVYRRSPLLASFDGVLVPTLGLATFVVGRGDDPSISVTGGDMKVGATSVPLDREGRALLRWPDQARVRLFNAAQIIQSEMQLREGREPGVDPEELSGAYVLVGASATGLYDLRPTPVRPRAPGVTFHATLLDNLLSDRFMKQTAGFANVLLMLLFVLPAAMAAAFAAGPFRVVLLYVVCLPLPIAASIATHAAGTSIPLIPLVLGVSFALVSVNILNYAVEGRQKKYIKNAFQQYLSPAVIEQLLAQPDRLRLGGEKRDLTIFFSDLEGFTSLSEGLSPEALTSLLNDYLSAMTDIIQEEGGTIDKYEGDAIIAFWNAPMPLADHALRGVRAALRCQRELSRLRPQFRDRVKKDLFMRIGINSGPAVVGNMGSRNRFDYTMLGDSVNLAARLEGINKMFGTYTLISGETVSRLEEGVIALREVSKVAVVGRKEPVTIFEPLSLDDFESRREEIEAFHAALQLYYQGEFRAALEAFAALEDRDVVAKVYRRRCEELFREPPKEWNGVWVMTGK